MVLSAPVHGRKAVAPLKLGIGAVGEVGEAAVHGRKAVAPLKPVSDAGGKVAHCAVHGRKAVAPLKLGGAVKCPAAKPPSTAARPWPH